MEMVVSKQFSTFMELLVQLCLTTCAPPSYGLWKWLASSSPHLWNCLRNCVLRFVQPRFTVCATPSYGLWKWLASSSLIYGTACATVSYGLCNPVLRFVQPRLTAYGNG
jgi:hypothetical protein